MAYATRFGAIQRGYRKSTHTAKVKTCPSTSGKGKRVECPACHMLMPESKYREHYKKEHTR